MNGRVTRPSLRTDNKLFMKMIAKHFQSYFLWVLFAAQGHSDKITLLEIVDETRIHARGCFFKSSPLQFGLWSRELLPLSSFG